MIYPILRVNCKSPLTENVRQKKKVQRAVNQIQQRTLNQQLAGRFPKFITLYFILPAAIIFPLNTTTSQVFSDISFSQCMRRFMQYACIFICCVWFERMMLLFSVRDDGEGLALEYSYSIPPSFYHSLSTEVRILTRSPDRYLQLY